MHIQPTLTFTCPIELKISTVFVRVELLSDLCECEEEVLLPILGVTCVFVSSIPRDLQVHHHFMRSDVETHVPVQISIVLTTGFILHFYHSP